MVQKMTHRLRAGTKLLSDYGNIRVSLRNAKYPIILQFVTTNGDVKRKKLFEARAYRLYKY